MWVPHLCGFQGCGFFFHAQPLKRYYGRDDLHFMTFSCYRRRAFLGTARARDCFVRILDQVRRKKEFLLLGFVVMPEHVHLLISEPRGSNPSKVLQVLKQQVSGALRKKRKRPPAKFMLGIKRKTHQRKKKGPKSPHVKPACGAPAANQDRLNAQSVAHAPILNFP